MSNIQENEHSQATHVFPVVSYMNEASVLKTRHRVTYHRATSVFSHHEEIL